MIVPPKKEKKNRVTSNATHGGKKDGWYLLLASHQIVHPNTVQVLWKMKAGSDRKKKKEKKKMEIGGNEEKMRKVFYTRAAPTVEFLFKSVGSFRYKKGSRSQPAPNGYFFGESISSEKLIPSVSYEKGWPRLRVCRSFPWKRWKLLANPTISWHLEWRFNHLSKHVLLFK